jgi:class 3 adenylate cyclase/tetratricopeptide (TPR) repeat protein
VPPHGERRQLTVLFADLVDATALSHRLDPEAFRELLDAYQRICGACVTRFEGHIKQFLGDGVLAYFGFPMAHENDAERAVRAGLAIVEETRRRREHAEGGIVPHVRIGIHTGLVVVGTLGTHPDRAGFAVGETPNVAARVQSHAAPDTVCISRATRTLLGDRIALRPLGLRAAKGLPDEIELFEVAAQQSVREEPVAPVPTLLIGRESERQRVLAAWRAACDGAGQAVMLSGEAGLGKSRLLLELRQGLPDAQWRELRGSPFNENSTFQPVIDVVNASLAVAAAAEPALSRAEHLRALLQRAGRADDVTFALLGALLGTADPASIVPPNLSLAQRKRRVIDALASWLVAPAHDGPMLIAFEDVHWYDASTKELIGDLLDRLVALPVLLVMTFRPEFVPQWKLRAHVSTITLGRLSLADSTAVVRQLAAAHEIPERLVDAIVRRADGVPLFVEELTKSMLDAREAADAKLAVPATLRDSLTARLDRLGPAKSVAQMASVLGREFDYAVLAAMSPLDEHELEEQLEVLSRADIIQQSSLASRAQYGFKHALIQEAAYDTLLRGARQAHHRDAAKTYVERFATVTATRPELIARHFMLANDPVAADAYWARAIELAIERQGPLEAIGHFDVALAAIPTLPAAMQSTSELALRLKVGSAMMSSLGFGAPRTGANYARACELGEAVGEPAARFAAMWGDWLHQNTTGKIESAALRSEQLVRLSRELKDPGYALQAHHSRWTNWLFMGQVASARADTTQADVLYDETRHTHHKLIFGGHDPMVCACNFGSFSAWQMGRASEAVARGEAGLALAQHLDHVLSIASAYHFMQFRAFFAGEYELAQDHAERLIALCNQHGIGQWLGMGHTVRAAARALRTGGRDGLDCLDDGVKTHMGRGSAGVTPMLLAVAAEACIAAGQAARALDLLGEAMTVSDRMGLYLHRPEVERLRVQLLLAAGSLDAPAAITALIAAGKLAALQGAEALAARIELTLAPLLEASGRPEDVATRTALLLARCDASADAPEIARLRARQGA